MRAEERGTESSYWWGSAPAVVYSMGLPPRGAGSEGAGWRPRKGSRGCWPVLTNFCCCCCGCW